MRAKLFPPELHDARERLLEARRAWQRIKIAFGYCRSDACTNKHTSGWCDEHKSMRKRAP